MYLVNYPNFLARSKDVCVSLPANQAALAPRAVRIDMSQLIDYVLIK